MPDRIAFLSGGLVHLLDADGQTAPVHSPFAEDYRNRAVAIQRRNEWKMAGSSATFQRGGVPLEMLQQQALNAAVSVTDLSRDAGSILFALRADQVTGIFRVDPESGREERLFHSNEYQVSSAAPRPDGEGEVACSFRSTNGTACIGLIDTAKGGLRELTEGDVLDEAPSWTPDGRRLLYQSAGIARDANGFVRAYGPRSVQCLDLDRGTLDELLADDERDYLTPRMNARGELFAIDRPWKPVKHASAWQVLRGILLLPFHIVMAIFHLVNNITRWYSKKPLLRDAGPRQQEQDEHMVLWGELVELGEQARGKRGHAKSDGPLVPDSWSLIRRGPDGEVEVVAKHVACFDLGPDGSPVWSDGRAIWGRGDDGRPRRIGTGKRVTHLAVIDRTPRAPSAAGA